MPTEVIIDDVKPISSTTCTLRKLATRRVVKSGEAYNLRQQVIDLKRSTPSNPYVRLYWRNMFLVQSLKGGSDSRTLVTTEEAVPSELQLTMFELVKSQPHFATKDGSFATNILVRSSRDDNKLCLKDRA